MQNALYSTDIMMSSIVVSLFNNEKHFFFFFLSQKTQFHGDCRYSIARRSNTDLSTTSVALVGMRKGYTSRTIMTLGFDGPL